MTKKIGSKHIAQHRGKKERAEIYKTNVAREAVKQGEARVKYRNEVKGQARREQAAAA
jgi:endonuclease YncB( thermonuclease family)